MSVADLQMYAEQAKAESLLGRELQWNKFKDPPYLCTVNASNNGVSQKDIDLERGRWVRYEYVHEEIHHHAWVWCHDTDRHYHPKLE